MPTATYDEVAEHYDSAMRPLERWFLRGLRQRAFQNLPQAGRVLELGAGTGLNFSLYPKATEGAATEPSGEMLKIASGKSRPPGLALVQSRAECLPFAADSFDAALATLVFCSVDSQSEAFSEIRRVVKAGGVLILLEHVRPGGLLGPVFDVLNVLTSKLFDDRVNRRTANAVANAGLEIIKREKRLLGIFNLIVCRV